MEVHTRLLTHKWHELLVLTTSAYQAIQKAATEQQMQMATTLIEPDFNQEVSINYLLPELYLFFFVLDVNLYIVSFDNFSFMSILCLECLGEVFGG